MHLFAFVSDSYLFALFISLTLLQLQLIELLCMTFCNAKRIFGGYFASSIQLNFFYSNSGNSIGRFADIGLVNFCCLFPVFFNSSSISHITVENCKEYYLTAGQITAISTFPFELSNQNSEYFNWLNSIDNTNLPFVQIYC